MLDDRHTDLTSENPSGRRTDEAIPGPRLPRRDLDHILHFTEGLWEDIRGGRIFLTGGTGFVGTWLLESLLWANDQMNLGVTVMALTRDPARFRRRSPHTAEHPAVHVLHGNAATFDFPEGAFPFVIHAATEPSCAPRAEQPLASFEPDINGTQRVLEFARSHAVRRFLFTSSGAIYGRQSSEMTNIPEEYGGAPTTVDAETAYGQAKRVSEFMCATYGHVYGFDAMIARLFAFVGPLLPLEANYAVGNFIRDIIGGGPVRIAGDGTPYRSYLYAADLAIWLWTILFRGRPAHPYNVGAPHALTILELAQTVIRAIAPGTKVEIAREAAPGTPPLRYVPSTERAESELGLRSLISLDEGIRRTADWYRGRDSQ